MLGALQFESFKMNFKVFVEGSGLKGMVGGIKEIVRVIYDYLPGLERGNAEHIEKIRMFDREWFIQLSCATTGDGLSEGMEWLISAMNRFHKIVKKKDRHPENW